MNPNIIIMKKEEIIGLAREMEKQILDLYKSSALLRYCELDTWAMVKVWLKLKEVTE